MTWRPSPPPPWARGPLAAYAPRPSGTKGPQKARAQLTPAAAGVQIRPILSTGEMVGTYQMSGRLSFSFPAAQAPPPSATSTAAADAITRLRVNRAPSRDRWPATVAERTKWFGARGYAGV